MMKNRLKRYSKNATLQALKDGYFICFYEYFTLNGGYKIIDKDYNIIGYITFELFHKLKSEDIITMYVGNYSNTVYGLVY